MSKSEKVLRERVSALDFFDRDPILSIERAAEFVGGVSKWTLYKMLSNGTLKRTRVGGRVMIRASELAKLVKE